MKKKIVRKSLLAISIAGALSLGFTDHFNKSLIKQGSEFNAEKYQENLLQHKQYVLGGVPGIMAAYDINKDSIRDVDAFYVYLYSSEGSNYTEKSARVVFIDEDQDGKLDYILFDSDGNKTLDKRVTEEELKGIFNDTKKTRQIET